MRYILKREGFILDVWGVKQCAVVGPITEAKPLG
jgi:hypothetical protein